MPRTARAVVGGMCYHVLNRGNNRAEIFHCAADYARFLALMDEAQEQVQLDLLGACLMPNHFHFVVRPKRDAELGEWMHWLMTTHVRRYHRQHRSSGRIWQGRFKAFPVQDDHHLLTVLRYVERNALTADLVDRAEHWPWGSLHWRMQQSAPNRLTVSPVPLPTNWMEWVNEPLTDRELDHLRGCVNRQRPFGAASWVELTAHALGLTSSLRGVGRPRRNDRMSAR